MMKIGSAQKSCYCNQKELSTYTTYTIANVMKCGGTTMKRLLKIIFKTLWSNHLSMRNLRLLAMVLLSLSCCSCITYSTGKFCNRCLEMTKIIDQHGYLSQDGTSFTINSKWRTEYRNNPFQKQLKSFVQEATHTYSLVTPERDGKLCCWTIIPSNTAHRFAASYSRELNPTKNNPVDISQINYNALIIPELYLPYSSSYAKKRITQIHPDDIPLLSKPFFIINDAGGKLAIPYNFKDNICYFYLPKEDIVYSNKFIVKQTTSNILLKTVLIPPAIVLDIVSMPIQASVVFCAICTGAFKHPLGP